MTITPTTATSKILLIAQVVLGSTGTSPAFLCFGGGNAGTYIGDAASSRVQTAVDGSPTSTTNMQGNTLIYLDSPATTSAITYAVQVRVGGVSPATVYLNRSSDDSNSSNRARGASSITAIEVPV